MSDISLVPVWKENKKTVDELFEDQLRCWNFEQHQRFYSYCTGNHSSMHNSC